MCECVCECVNVCNQPNCRETQANSIALSHSIRALEANRILFSINFFRSSFAHYHVCSLSLSLFLFACACVSEFVGQLPKRKTLTTYHKQTK